MGDISELNELLHFMKNPKRTKWIFTQATRGSKNWCPFTHDHGFDLGCYLRNPAVQYLMKLLQSFMLRFEFLNIRKYSLDEMKKLYSSLTEIGAIISYENFSEKIQSFKELVKIHAEDVSKKMDLLTCDECIRLDESLVCYENYCFFASVVMAVSAVESRMHHLLKKTDSKTYKSDFERATLGQLLRLFDENHYKEQKFRKLKSILPKKHKPLVEILNQYRVFSAHPKEEKVDHKIAESVLNLSFSFLLDEELAISDKKKLVCAK